MAHRLSQKLAIVSVLCIICSACSSLPEETHAFINRDDIADRERAALQKITYDSGTVFISPAQAEAAANYVKQRFAPQERGELVFRANSGLLGVETLMQDNTGNEKARFDKSYLYFGADRRNSMVGLRLRFTY